MRQNPPRDERTQARRLKELERRLHILETTSTVTPWTPIALNAGYSARDAARPPAYRFLSATRVELRGTINKGDGSGGVGANGFANSDTPFTLPSGLDMWPSGLVRFAAACMTRASNFGVCYLDLSVAGVATFRTSAAHDPGFVSLDGWSYDVV